MIMLSTRHCGLPVQRHNSHKKPSAQNTAGPGMHNTLACVLSQSSHTLNINSSQTFLASLSKTFLVKGFRREGYFLTAVVRQISGFNSSTIEGSKTLLTQKACHAQAYTCTTIPAWKGNHNEMIMPWSYVYHNLDLACAEDCAGLLHSASYGRDREGVFQIAHEEVLTTYKGDSARFPWQHQEIVVTKSTRNVCLHHDMWRNPLWRQLHGNSQNVVSNLKPGLREDFHDSPWHKHATSCWYVHKFDKIKIWGSDMIKSMGQLIKDVDGILYLLLSSFQIGTELHNLQRDVSKFQIVSQVFGNSVKFLGFPAANIPWN